jgi:hypothetical protein
MGTPGCTPRPPQAPGPAPRADGRWAAAKRTGATRRALAAERTRQDCGGTTRQADRVGGDVTRWRWAAPRGARGAGAWAPRRPAGAADAGTTPRRRGRRPRRHTPRRVVRGGPLRACPRGVGGAQRPRLERCPTAGPLAEGGRPAPPRRAPAPRGASPTPNAAHRARCAGRQPPKQGMTRL